MLSILVHSFFPLEPLFWLKHKWLLLGSCGESATCLEKHYPLWKPRIPMTTGETFASNRQNMLSRWISYLRLVYFYQCFMILVWSFSVKRFPN
uniref:Uncharacterized protein n=1 Tax=Rhizophora mucronata TaxID=61149 RepID=A0A2P2J726_RHIMU